MDVVDFTTLMREFINSPAGISMLVLATLFAGAREIWVYGWVYRSAVKRSEWLESQLDVALKGWRQEQQANEEHYRVAHPEVRR